MIAATSAVRVSGIPCPASSRIASRAPGVARNTQIRRSPVGSLVRRDHATARRNGFAERGQILARAGPAVEKQEVFSFAREVEAQRASHAPHGRGPRRWTNGPQRSMWHKWPSVTSESSGEVNVMTVLYEM